VTGRVVSLGWDSTTERGNGIPKKRSGPQPGMRKAASRKGASDRLHWVKDLDQGRGGEEKHPAILCSRGQR